MKTVSFKSTKADLPAILEKCRQIDPQIVTVFAAPAYFKDKSIVADISAQLPGVNVMGCSSAGEVSADGVSDDGFSILAMHFDQTDIKFSEAAIPTLANSRASGQSIGKQLNAENLRGIFVLCPGVEVSGSELVRGITDIVGAQVTITGGLAGDGQNFANTYTILNGDIFPNHAVAFGLYGDKVRIGSGSRGGWKPFGPVRRVTKAEGNVLYELDGKPALRLYKEYLGEKAKELPASGFLYPFSIIREDDMKEIGLIRTVHYIDHDAESMALAGDLPQGSLVRLMHSDTDSLVNGARDAAREATQVEITTGVGSSAAFLISCIGRRIIMGNDVEEEIESAIEALGGSACVAGFYSYGEICPFAETGCAELHNQTMTVTHISEVA
jgi:hypothetical protein